MHHQAKKKHPIQPGVELLETRGLLSGDVAVSVVDGDLIVRGDALDNRVRIDQAGLGAGEFRVTGEVFTSVNGDSTPVMVSGVTRDVRITLGDESDRLVLYSLVIPRDLRIAAGAASDWVLVHQTQVGGELRIKSNAGDDSVHLSGLDVAGLASVLTLGGDDVVTLEKSVFHGDASVSTAAGNDTILTQEATFEQMHTLDLGSGNNLITSEVVPQSYIFQSGALGWKAGFADYNPDHHVIDAESGIRDLPAELGPGTGFYLAGSNASDDLFMFLKRRIGPAQGIEPNRLYQVRFTVVFGSNAPSGAVGIGGSPGESVFLKAGASATNPHPVRADDGHLRMNVDKGEQANGGPAGSVVGTIGNGLSNDEGPPPYVSLQRHYIHESLVRADAQGNVWLLVGTDSGFEGRTALYYQRIDVKLIPVSDLQTQV